MTDEQKTPFDGDDYYDDGFADIPADTYCFSISDIKKIKRDTKGTLRAEFELEIAGVVDGASVVESDWAGRKIWENGALEGEQIMYFVGKLLRAIRERNPDKTVYIDAVPFLGDGKLADIVVPEGQESEWEEYLMPFVNLDVICSIRVKSKDEYGTKYYKNFPKDQSAGLSSE